MVDSPREWMEKMLKQNFDYIRVTALDKSENSAYVYLYMDVWDTHACMCIHLEHNISLESGMQNVNATINAIQ